MSGDGGEGGAGDWEIRNVCEDRRQIFIKILPYFMLFLRDVLLTLPPECNTRS